MILNRPLLFITLFIIGHSTNTMAQENGTRQKKIQTGHVQQKNKAPLKRKDSFFGLHFDFHAVVDCKGHPGISSYPTKVGTPAKSFDKDPLKIWREVTRKYGVALYVHHSGVYENQAVKLHPDWAAINAAGKMDSDKISVHSGYVDELLIPQLKELSRDYGVDGVWVDGDCWAVVPDYSPAALKAFQAETGITNIPRSSNDSGYARFLDFNRKSFLDYVQH